MAGRKDGQTYFQRSFLLLQEGQQVQLRYTGI